MVTHQAIGQNSANVAMEHGDVALIVPHLIKWMSQEFAHLLTDANVHEDDGIIISSAGTSRKKTKELDIFEQYFCCVRWKVSGSWSFQIHIDVDVKNIAAWNNNDGLTVSKYRHIHRGI